VVVLTVVSGAVGVAVVGAAVVGADVLGLWEGAAHKPQNIGHAAATVLDVAQLDVSKRDEHRGASTHDDIVDVGADVGAPVGIAPVVNPPLAARVTGIIVVVDSSAWPLSGETVVVACAAVGAAVVEGPPLDTVAVSPHPPHDAGHMRETARDPQPYVATTDAHPLSSTQSVLGMGVDCPSALLGPAANTRTRTAFATMPPTTATA
jgi:hypothetical protein